jgi:hypothetical protein
LHPILGVFLVHLGVQLGGCQNPTTILQIDQVHVLSAAAPNKTVFLDRAMPPRQAVDTNDKDFIDIDKSIQIVDFPKAWSVAGTSVDEVRRESSPEW